MTAPDRPNINLVSLLWAGPETAQDIARLHATLFDPAWDEASIVRTLEHPGSTALIARHGFPKQSIGFVLGQLAADEAEVLSIGVDRTWQGQGLGKRLLEGLIRSLSRAQVKQVHLEVAADNEPALALYRGFQFIEAGRRKGYYTRPNIAPVDALTLTRTL